MKKIESILLYIVFPVMTPVAILVFCLYVVGAGQRFQKEVNHLFQQHQETIVAQAHINSMQAAELLERPTWYWVGPGIISSTMDGTGKRVDYNSGISGAIAANHHPLSRNMPYPKIISFSPNTNSMPESICGGLLVMNDAN